MRNSLQLIIFVIAVRVISTQKCAFKLEDGTAIVGGGFGIELNGIEDIEKPGKTLITLIGENVESIESIDTNSESKLLYVNATLQESSIVVKLTENFVNYEEREWRKIITITINFKCKTDIHKLEIVQPIIDTNNHDPEFLNAPYTYTLPMPFPKDFRLDLMGEISARDIDLTNNEISFALDSNDPVSEAFEASWSSVGTANPKHLHYANLKTTAILHLLEKITFRIYATDSGIPPRTAYTTVTINMDKANSVLSFSKTVYTANCSNLIPEEADGFTLKFNEGDISLVGGTDGTIDWSVEDVSGKYNNNFKINYSPDVQTIKISVVNPPASFFNEAAVVLILSAKKPGAVESTVLRLTLPGRELSSTDCTAIIIALAVILTIVSAGFIVFIILSRRRARLAKQMERINGVPEPREEMRQVDRMESDPSPNGLARRSVAFNDTVEEIKVASL